MALSLRPEHLRRYKDVALLLYRYGRADIVRRAGLSELLPEESDRSERGTRAAAGLADDVERLGPTFIKLGQLLSTRPDIVPPAYADVLARLQNECEPIPFQAAHAILAAELGERMGAFARIEEQPLAAASIAQVHRATLRDGREVAVKIQRPDITPQVMHDLDALAEVARLLDRHSELGQRFRIELMFEEFRRSLLRELDFRQEAMHLAAIRGNLAEIPEIFVPRPLTELSSARVLTMEYVAGRKISAVGPLGRLELDGERLADALFRAYLKQILRDGVFHADPHPGNVLLMDDGRIALIDLGMVGRVPPGLDDRLLQLLLAVSDNRPDDAAGVLLLVAERRRHADERSFRRAVTDIVAQHQEVMLHQPQVGRTLLMLLKAAGDNGVALPPELAMIGKTLLNLDEIGRTLAPRFDPNAAIRRHAAEITRERMMRDLSAGSIFSAAVDLKNFVARLPDRVSRILNRIADNDLQIRVNAFDEARLMEGLQKVANRITLGLVLAALIVGAALLMDVPTSFQLFGYPGIAILLFLGAAIGGMALVVTILLSDIRASRRP